MRPRTRADSCSPSLTSWIRAETLRGSRIMVRPPVMELQRLVKRAGELLVKKGLAKTLTMSVEKLTELAQYPLMKRSNSRKTFEVGGKPYRYFTHHYNATWRNERAVEVPLVTELLASVSPGARCSGG